jgi:hypothetical protein
MKMFKTLLTVLMSALLLVSFANASVAKGQKVFMKDFKKKTGVTAAKFAAEHTQDEWEELFENDAAGFIKEYSEKYPKLEKYLNNPKKLKKIKNLGEFLYEYGSDSGNVPACG